MPGKWYRRGSQEKNVKAGLLRGKTPAFVLLQHTCDHRSEARLFSEDNLSFHLSFITIEVFFLFVIVTVVDRSTCGGTHPSLRQTKTTQKEEEGKIVVTTETARVP
jgi:hypothetical protein